MTWLGIYLHEKDEKCIKVLIGKPSSRSKNINNIDLNEIVYPLWVFTAFV
jgi:hypothetical protein